MVERFDGELATFGFLPLQTIILSLLIVHTRSFWKEVVTSSSLLLWNSLEKWSLHQPLPLDCSHTSTTQASLVRVIENKMEKILLRINHQTTCLSKILHPSIANCNAKSILDGVPYIYDRLPHTHPMSISLCWTLTLFFFLPKFKNNN